MNVFVFQAALLCESCGNETIAIYKRGDYADTGDSDSYPQGPFSDGGGESDTPCHCDICGVFLENPLTPDGVKYVTETIAKDSLGSGPCITQWKNFYRDELQ